MSIQLMAQECIVESIHRRLETLLDDCNSASVNKNNLEAYLHFHPFLNRLYCADYKVMIKLWHQIISTCRPYIFMADSNRNLCIDETVNTR